MISKVELKCSNCGSAALVRVGQGASFGHEILRCQHCGSQFDHHREPRYGERELGEPIHLPNVKSKKLKKRKKAEKWAHEPWHLPKHRRDDADDDDDDDDYRRGKKKKKKKKSTGKRLFDLIEDIVDFID